MTLSKAIIKRINNLMRIKNIENPHQLALKCGLDESVIRSVLSGRTIHPSVHTMFFIAFGFNMTLSEFYNDKLFDIANIDEN
ncbi:MAG: helix-turn-helix transcriptional regulator [Clostridia bacterium]|nr:helix-turn-helix transcriptional regulator [Clostridia bacterium]